MSSPIAACGPEKVLTKPILTLCCAIADGEPIANAAIVAAPNNLPIMSPLPVSVGVYRSRKHCIQQRLIGQRAYAHAHPECSSFELTGKGQFPEPMRRPEPGRAAIRSVDGHMGGARGDVCRPLQADAQQLRSDTAPLRSRQQVHVEVGG